MTRNELIASIVAAVASAAVKAGTEVAKHGVIRSVPAAQEASKTTVKLGAGTIAEGVGFKKPVEIVVDLAVALAAKDLAAPKAAEIIGELVDEAAEGAVPRPTGLAALTDLIVGAREKYVGLFKQLLQSRIRQKSLQKSLDKNDEYGELAEKYCKENCPEGCCPDYP